MHQAAASAQKTHVGVDSESNDDRAFARRQEVAASGRSSRGACRCGGTCSRCSASASASGDSWSRATSSAGAPSAAATPHVHSTALHGTTRGGQDFSRVRVHGRTNRPADEDALEREADRFADAVTSGSGGPQALSLGAAGQVHDRPNPLMKAALEAGVSSPGEPLSGRWPRVSDRTLDPSIARVHRDAMAHSAARLTGARAYTYGRHIVLGSEASDLSRPAARRTLAHELAHVGQQTAFHGEPGEPRAQFSMETYLAAMHKKPEPDWKTAAEHLNGEPPAKIKIMLRLLTPQHRAKLHEAAREWPGLCSNIGRLTESDYLKEHPDTTARVANTCDQKPPPAPAGEAPAEKPAERPADRPFLGAAARDLTPEDERTCSVLYQHKLCVYIRGGFNGDRSGVETAEEMAFYNKECRDESGYEGGDVQLSDDEKRMLRSPKCERGNAAEARLKARARRVTEALNRSVKYMPAGVGDRIVGLINDPIFLGSLALAVGVYIAAWLAPEPVFTKIAAAATTIAILSTGVFSISTIVNLANAWMDLESEAGSVQSDEQIEAAARRFGHRMGGIEADLLVFLASLLVGGRIPGPKRLPAPAKAIADAERAVAGAQPGGVVIEGPWGRARSTTVGEPTAVPQPGSNVALKVEYAPKPAAVPEPARPLPANDNAVPLPAPKPATATQSAPASPPTPVMPVVPGVSTAPGQQPGPRPPFVLKLPQQKAPHLNTYRGWIGVLQSDPQYQRGSPAQLGKWHRALRLGGSHGIPASVYERGHRMGFTGEAGERRIRVPDWSRTRSTPMEVDHIIELQVTPSNMRNEFNSVSNYELLDRTSNGTSGPLLAANIAAERARQVAHDPSAATRVLRFDRVDLDGGTPGERWSVEQLRAGEQLDAYERR